MVHARSRQVISSVMVVQRQTHVVGSRDQGMIKLFGDSRACVESHRATNPCLHNAGVPAKIELMQPDRQK